ncbi:MAG TPA: cell division protein FtsZ [Accumulibacter sp.]|uniref:Cell division protein FtsZ n=2 Tax=Candidatus Accumulibacter TaxID=327159 RepID=A0A080MB07_9PROT|nr:MULTISPECIES: cell division protein FtsZ [Candidatus Accumulibacter]KFB78136.1 MAG: Cell division protein FtsZ [Candidatus Accumulibacter cognatus]MBL8400363.1 cell division protein FtsZ [Accumulibacter sp.]MBN8516372.1 cell division protein FtsZ [Accumulibacter sp.]MBO3712410.1 cell division protein FtsZ [Accumulibacter sp.]MCC2867564.1 cell division protein FtsZ [Candidatus Accumulibacter phosphatis]
MFEIIDKEESERDTVIKVIGIGGAGGNAVDHMIREGVNGVDFITANTDSQALGRSIAIHKLQLGKTGLGAGAKPEAGRSAAIEERDAIVESLKGAHMVFITAGMGGGTGTGAAPIVAEVARELGVLTVAVVTKPFGFEGKRLKVADVGIAELQKHVDSLIVILNDRLMDVLGDDVSMDDAFKAADNVLRNAVGGIAEIINFPGLVNVDFEDVRTVMGEMGMAMMGSANAAGVDRARIAAERAVSSPLLEGVNLSGAKGVLVNITATRSLKMKEVNEVMTTVRAFAADDAHIIFGAVYDENMGEEIRVTVVATGLGQAQAKRFEVINSVVNQGTGTDGRFSHAANIDYSSLDQVPAIVRKGRSATVEALANSGVDRYDIPAFLRKQAD